MGDGQKQGRQALKAAAFAVVYFTTFVAMSLVYAIANRGYRYTADMLPFDLSLVAAGSATGLGLWWLLARIADRPFGQQVGLAALTVAAGSVVLQAATNASISLLLPGPKPWAPPSLLQLIGQSLFWLLPLGLWSAIFLARVHDKAARERERRLAKARAEAQDAQLRALRYQINPHFLYNTLNSIAALVLDGRNAAAETMIVRLSDFLRATLESDPTADVTLAEEVQLQRLYLDIERARYPDNLAVTIDIPAEIAGAKVPALILQPLIENALKHGVSPRGETRVRVAAQREGNALVLDVSDDGPGHGVEGGTGLGLANVRRRLENRFGGEAELKTRRLASGFAVTLSFPLALA